jgi:O-antigen ligase
MCGTSADAKYNMLNRLQPASRLLIRASLGVFTAIVLLLIQSAFWSMRVSAWMQAIIFAIALLSYFRPQYGLLAIALLAPLGQVGSRTLDSQMRGAEAIVLAFLAGALVRGWTLRGFRAFPSTRLDVAALIFGFVVAASCLEQIWFSQIQLDFAWPYAQDALGYASRNYITSSRGFGMLPRAMWLLEGSALLVVTVRYVSASAQFIRRLIITLVSGAIATAMLTLTAVATEFAQTRGSDSSVIDFFARGRWSGHISDVNAAGSYFAMMALLALGLGLRDREWRWPWLVSGGALLLTTLVTGSRTAAAAIGVVATVVLVRASVSHTSYAVRAVSAAGVVATLGAAAFLIFRTTGATPSEAISIRWMFLQATAGMLAAEPAFGVGVGQFSLWSAHFAPPALFRIWRPDNAHNNLAQIAGELGIVGFVAFCVMLAAAFGSPMDDHRTPIADRRSWRAPLIAGLGVFILTWLGGHPLLVPEAAYPFWIMLGLAGAFVAAGSESVSTKGLVAVAAAVLLASIPFRIHEKSAKLDLTQVTYGLSARHLMTSRARFFVPRPNARVDVPLRARGASDDEPVEVEVSVDGEVSETISLGGRDWEKASIELPGDSTGRFYQIDLRVKTDSADTLNRAGSSVEVGTWEIVAKPNG